MTIRNSVNVRALLDELRLIEERTGGGGDTLPDRVDTAVDDAWSEVRRVFKDNGFTLPNDDRGAELEGFLYGLIKAGSPEDARLLEELAQVQRGED